MDGSKIQFALFGGDARQTCLLRILRDAGYKVASFGVPMEEDEGDWKSLAERADCLLLPLPLTRDGVHLFSSDEKKEPIRLDLLAKSAGKIVFGGRIPDPFREMAESGGACVFDYFDSEYLQILNALPTAEGALYTAMRELPVTIAGTSVAVVGYGRIGRLLVDRLVALGARVTVYERKIEKQAYIEAAHATPKPIFDDAGNNLLSRLPEDCRAVFTTVPEPIFDREVLAGVPQDCVLIDLASPPGGIDSVAASELGVKTIWATALPGKYAPESAASYLAKTVFATLESLV